MPLAPTLPAGQALFFRQPQTSELPPLEMFVKVREPNEHHFYCRNVAFADFAAVFGDVLRPLACLVYRMPPALLNPNYWEPLTRENEAAVREKMAAMITRQEGDRTLLWRSDAVAKGRLLRDGLDVELDLAQGYVFRVSGEGLLRLGKAWDGRDRFEWIAFAELPSGEKLSETALNAHADLSAFRLGTPSELALFASQEGRTRVLFSDSSWMRRAVSAAAAGFVSAVTGSHCASIPEKTAGRLARLCDGLGLRSDPRRDLVDKGRTIELTVHLGRTEWGLQLPPGQEPPNGDEKALLYYDRTSGLWAVAS